MLAKVWRGRPRRLEEPEDAVGCDVGWNSNWREAERLDETRDGVGRPIRAPSLSGLDGDDRFPGLAPRNRSTRIHNECGASPGSQQIGYIRCNSPIAACSADTSLRPSILPALPSRTPLSSWDRIHETHLEHLSCILDASSHVVGVAGGHLAGSCSIEVLLLSLRKAERELHALRIHLDVDKLGDARRSTACTCVRSAEPRMCWQYSCKKMQGSK